MTSKRILVRVINHVLAIDSHEMVMAEPGRVCDTIDEQIAVLAMAAGYPVHITSAALMPNARHFGDVTMVTHFQDGWLLQVRVDSKQMDQPRVAANDNDAVQQSAQG